MTRQGLVGQDMIGQRRAGQSWAGQSMLPVRDKIGRNRVWQAVM